MTIIEIIIIAFFIWLFKVIVIDLLTKQPYRDKVSKEMFLVKDFNDEGKQIINYKLWWKSGKFTEYNFVGTGKIWNLYPSGNLVKQKGIYNKLFKMWLMWVEYQKNNNGEFLYTIDKNNIN